MAERQTDQLDFGLFATMLTGTSVMPRAAAAFAHFAMRSIDNGINGRTRQDDGSERNG